MANVGLNNLWYGLLTEAADGTPSYDGAKSFGKAVSCSVSVNNNDAKLFADDVLNESDTTFSNATVTLGVADDDDTVFAPVLGHTLTDGVVTKTATDTAPYIGLGRIITKMVNGQYKYKAKFLYKVKFSEPSSDENTKGESVEFSTPSIEGLAAALSDEAGTWCDEKTFTSKADALTWIKNKLAAAGTKYRITFDLMGGESATIEDTDVTAGDSINLDDGTNITAPSGKVFVGWATESTATTANVTSPYTPSEDVTLYAVYANET